MPDVVILLLTRLSNLIVAMGLLACASAAFAQESSPALWANEPAWIGAAEASAEPGPAARPAVPLRIEPDWAWQVLPAGLMYRSYLAGQKESRFASEMVYDRYQGWLWEVALGGQVGFLRYGTNDPASPEGFQVDLEGAAFPRLSPELDRDVLSTDFRFGVPFTWRQGPWEAKCGYKHESSHLGDEYMVRHPDALRINYVREVLLAGLAFYPHPDIRLYGETGWAFQVDDGAEPWEFQFGAEYSPAAPSGLRGTPFAAVNTRLRQEIAFGGNVTLEAGWQWRGDAGQRFRLGGVYFNGMSEQYQFFRIYEDKLGFGIWYDF